MKQIFILIFLLTLLVSVHSTQAQEFFSDSLPESSIEEVPVEDAGWEVTKHATDAEGSASFASDDTLLEEKHLEIVNDSSMNVTRALEPLEAGTLQFKMRHNKLGLFYLYAQTSDAGGQLLFSIQFTQSNGILLEQSDRQISLLPDYEKDKWYSFIIDFDNSRGENGAFKISIDDITYGEHAYVNSESDLFDLAQITLGSESTGETSISSFDESFSISTISTATTSTTTVTASNDLKQLSIALATSSITANLEDGYIVTATFDGVPEVPSGNATTVSNAGTSTGTSSESSIGGFIMNIVESVIDVFLPLSQHVTSIEPASQPEQSETSTALETAVPEVIDTQESESEIQSIQTSTQNNEEVITTTF